MESTKSRIRYIDLVKAVAMFSVVYSHCLQYAEINNIQWVLTFVTAYHMPLFMMVSGYFLPKTLELPLVDFCKKIFKLYVVPYFIFGLVGQIIHFCSVPEFILQMVVTRWFNFFYHYDFWFIRDLIFLIVLLYISFQLSRKKLWLALIVSIIIFNIIPMDTVSPTSKEWSPLHNSTFFLFPFLWGGIILKKYPKILSKASLKWLVPVCLLLFGLFRYRYSFYCQEHYNLISYFYLQPQDLDFMYWTLFFFRYFLGFWSCLTIWKICEWADKQACISKLNDFAANFGTLTLGVYFIHSYLLHFVSDSPAHNIFLDFFLFPMIIIAVSWVISYLITKSPLKWMLGK